MPSITNIRSRIDREIDNLSIDSHGIVCEAERNNLHFFVNQLRAGHVGYDVDDLLKLCENDLGKYISIDIDAQHVLEVELTLHDRESPLTLKSSVDVYTTGYNYPEMCVISLEKALPFVAYLFSNGIVPDIDIPNMDSYSITDHLAMVNRYKQNVKLPIKLDFKFDYHLESMCWSCCLICVVDYNVEEETRQHVLAAKSTLFSTKRLAKQNAAQKFISMCMDEESKFDKECTMKSLVQSCAQCCLSECKTTGSTRSINDNKIELTLSVADFPNNRQPIELLHHLIRECDEWIKS